MPVWSQLRPHHLGLQPLLEMIGADWSHSMSDSRDNRLLGTAVSLAKRGGRSKSSVIRLFQERLVTPMH